MVRSHASAQAYLLYVNGVYHAALRYSILAELYDSVRNRAAATLQRPLRDG